MVANYHTHTSRCHHATGTERAYIEKAIAEGLDTLGFSDHVPMPFADGHQSGYRVLIEELEDYIRTLEALREEYKDRIRILIGFEAEYYPDVFADMLALIGRYDYDYLILGQHFIGNEDVLSCTAPTDSEERLCRYVDQVIEALKTGKYSYVAHPDVLNFNGNDEVYGKHMRRLCEACLSLNIPLEINLLGMRDGRHYPSERFFRIAAEVGNAVLLGCDAHEPCSVADPENVRAGYELAERLGLQVSERLVLRNPRA